MKKVALALASGGPRGFAYIGAIEELLARGYEISSIAGASAGSLVGGIYAAGGLEAFKQWLFDLDPVKVMTLMDVSVSRSYLVKGERVINEIKARVPEVNIQDLPIPFTAVATDLYTGEEVLFREGPLFEAIRASISIPSMFKPVVWKGRTLVDGGMVNTFPLNRVARTEGDILFLNVGWGLGMGMVMDGKLYYGKSGFSGEIGHFPLLDNNIPCRCGKIGCLETGASGSALHRLVVGKLSDGRASVLSRSYAAGEEITLDSILDAVKKEDVLCIECVEEVGETLGRAVAGLINIFNPNIVVIGGRLCATEKYLIPPLRSTVNKLSLNLVNSDTVIKVSQLGEKAGAIGSSLLAKHSYLIKQ